MTEATTPRQSVLTTEAQAHQAREVLGTLSGPSGSLSVESNGHRTAALPPEIGRVLQQVLETMSRGGTITVSAIPDELTTTTAAQILDISRPTLMKMIRSGQIPSHQVGSHHRLRSDDVFAALRERRARERAALAALMEASDDI